jgi:hypothetical protein
VSTSEGGTLLEYEDEDPQVRRRYRDALKANGVENQMPDDLYQPGFARKQRG